MTTAQIQQLKDSGYTADQVYARAATRMGHYHIAFYGHKYKDRAFMRKAVTNLNRVWRRIVKVYGREQMEQEKELT